MASLADELLNDFEESGSEVEENGVEEIQTEENGKMDIPEESNGSYQVENRGEEPSAVPATDIKSASKLMSQIRPVLSEIQRLDNMQMPGLVGHIEDNPEYKLLGEANSLSVSIDSEVVALHKYVRDRYSVRFPELEQLVGNPIDYCKTVAIIQNGPGTDAKLDITQELSSSTDNPVGAPLSQILPGPTMMVVKLEASSTKGRRLTEQELQPIVRACQLTLEFDKAKYILTEFVQSRMNLFAPNLTNLIGSLTAAQLINFAGGIAGLAKTPACNLAPLGAKKQTGTGFATNVGVRHQGFLYQSPLLRDLPNELVKQAMRIVSAKVVLAARIDAAHMSQDGSEGEKLKADVHRRIDKLTEAPANQGVKALPAPDDKPSRKRGGRQARKAKEATAMTDLRKAQNRMAFGKEEQEVGFGDSTKGLGMVGQGNEGRIRAQQIDQRTRAKLSKKNPGWGAAPTSGSGLASSLRGVSGSGTATVLRGHGLRSSGVGASSLGPGGGAGTASTIAFTPVQGLELIDPKIREEMNRKRKAEDDRWFNKGTFTQVGGGTTATGPPKMDADGFKMPQMPPNKKQNTGAG
jgi:U4/U6 small nuclear ribonucleoprotein PRP31